MRSSESARASAVVQAVEQGGIDGVEPSRAVQGDDAYAAVVDGEYRLIHWSYRGVKNGGSFALRMSQGFVEGLEQILSESVHFLSFPALLIASTSVATARRCAGLKSVLADFEQASSAWIGICLPP